MKFLFQVLEFKKHLLKSEIKAVYILLILNISGSFFEATSLGIIVPYLKIISNPENLHEILPSFILDLSFTYEEILVLSSAVLLFVFILKNIFLSYLNWRQYKFAYTLQVSLSQRLLNNYINQPLIYHLENNSTKLIQNVINEINILVFNLINPFISLMTEFFLISFTLIFLLLIEPAGTLIIIGVLGSASFIFNFYTKHHINKFGQERIEHDSIRIKILQQSLNGIKDVILTNSFKYFSEQFYFHNNKSSRAGQKISFLKDLSRYWIELVTVVCLVLFVLSSIFFSGDNTKLVPILGLFGAAFFRILPSLNRVLTNIQSIRFSLPILKLFETDLRVSSVKPIIQKSEIDFNDKIKISDLEFKFPTEDKNVLNNISIEILKGQIIGIKGESGCGKSTLIDLIMGLIEPLNGSIKVDFIDIKLSKESWYKKIGYVSQNIFLLDDTLRKNIAFGLSENQISESDLSESLKSTNLISLVNELKYGVDTKVGERGARLSGGQVQRIGIARALYRKPAILILDEATSALDYETEKGIMKSIYGLKGGITIIIIAHRISTLYNCDKIIELKDGKVIKTGTPQDFAIYEDC